MENNFVAIMSFLSQVLCPVRWSLLCMAWWTQHEPPKSITRARAYIHLCQRVTAHSSRRSADRQFVNNSKWLLIFEAEQHGGWKSHQMDSFHPPSSFLLLPLPLMERRSRVRYEEKEESRGRGGGSAIEESEDRNMSVRWRWCRDVTRRRTTSSAKKLSHTAQRCVTFWTFNVKVGSTCVRLHGTHRRKSTVALMSTIICFRRPACDPSPCRCAILISFLWWKMEPLLLIAESWPHSPQLFTIHYRIQLISLLNTNAFPEGFTGLIP